MLCLHGLGFDFDTPSHTHSRNIATSACGILDLSQVHWVWTQNSFSFTQHSEKVLGILDHNFLSWSWKSGTHFKLFDSHSNKKKNIKQRTQRCFHRSPYPEEPGFVLEVTFPAAPLAAVLLGLLRVAVPQGAHLHQAALALDQSARHNASTSHSVSRARLHPPGSLNSSTREAEPFVFPLPTLKHDPSTVSKACTRTVLPGNW